MHQQNSRTEASWRGKRSSLWIVRARGGRQVVVRLRPHHSHPFDDHSELGYRADHHHSGEASGEAPCTCSLPNGSEDFFALTG